MSITLEPGLNRLDVSLTSRAWSIWGTVTEADGYTPLVGVEVTGNNNKIYTDDVGFYRLTHLPQGTYTLTFYKPQYKTVTRQIVLDKPTELNVSLSRISPVRPTVMWTRIRPSAVITLGETIYIDAQLRCDTPGTYAADCIIDGVVLTQSYTFSPEQVWSVRVYEYTPTEPKIYTYTILEATGAFEVRERVIGIFDCPYCGMHFDNSGDLLGHFLTAEGFHYWYDYTDGSECYRLTCPYCSLEHSEWGPEHENRAIKSSVALWLIDHISTNHSLLCYICGLDLTFAGKAEERGNKWASHLVEYHGKMVPSVEVTPLYQVQYRVWPYYSVDYYDTYWVVGGAAQGEQSLQKSSNWINYFNATMITPSPAYWFGFAGEAGDYIAELKFRIPVLANKSWTLQFAGWKSGYPVNQVPDPLYKWGPLFTGSGDLVKIPPERLSAEYTRCLTAVIRYDAEVLVIPNVYLEPGTNYVQVRQNPNFDQLWIDP